MSNTMIFCPIASPSTNKSGGMAAYEPSKFPVLLFALKSFAANLPTQRTPIGDLPVFSQYSIKSAVTYTRRPNSLLSSLRASRTVFSWWSSHVQLSRYSCDAWCSSHCFWRHSTFNLHVAFTMRLRTSCITLMFLKSSRCRRRPRTRQ